MQLVTGTGLAILYSGIRCSRRFDHYLAKHNRVFVLTFTCNDVKAILVTHRIQSEDIANLSTVNSRVIPANSVLC